MNLSWVSQMGPTALIVLGVLLSFSVVSWSIILLKLSSIKQAVRSSAEFMDVFWQLRRFDQVYEESKRFDKSPTARVFRKGFQAISGRESKEPYFNVFLEDTLRKASLQEMNELERFTPFLATVGSTSTYIGLFGTVVGIMSSFEQIGLKGSASLATVAPGIAEALVATAAGLLAAIPAVIAFNHLSNRLRLIGLELETFSSDFMQIAREQALKA